MREDDRGVASFKLVWIISLLFLFHWVGMLAYNKMNLCQYNDVSMLGQVLQKVMYECNHIIDCCMRRGKKVSLKNVTVLIHFFSFEDQDYPSLPQF